VSYSSIVLDDLADAVPTVAAESEFWGSVQVVTAGNVAFEAGFGLADARSGTPNTPATRFGVASGTKGFTALAVMSLIEAGAIALSTTARSILGDDLPLIDDAVTLEHLLGHRSGIGDYLDEETPGDIADYVLQVPVHELDSTPHYLPIIEGYPQVFVPGERFAYCNGGYVILALIAGRVSDLPFEQLVSKEVFEPAGMTASSFLRSDEIPANAAVGYVDVVRRRTNALHLPVLGSGDGGAYSTIGDMSRFWTALFAGKIVSEPTVVEMVRPRSDVPTERRRYGLGFWLHETAQAVGLQGYDAGISFRSVHNPSNDLTHTTISNTSEGAWPVSKAIDQVTRARFT
jgi:CubicO group peptidase (beta-lactamase class C family)